MDSLRGRFPDRDDFGDRDYDSGNYDSGEDEAGHEPPPAPVGQDERRMQVRAYNHWASLLGQRSFPSIEDLEPANLPDFSPHSVLLDFTGGIEDPGIRFLGQKLARECMADGGRIERLSDVPSRSLLSRITDHYMQILANQAPIGFEAEFVNIRGATILYRGILLPFSSDDDTIDFIYGVINWKELADQKTSDDLLLEIDQALAAVEPAHEGTPLTAWADGPMEGGASPVAAGPDLDATAEDILDLDAPLDPDLSFPASTRFNLGDGFDYGFSPDPIGWPAPSFGADFEPESEEIQPLFGEHGLLARKDRSGPRSGLLAGATLASRGPKAPAFDADPSDLRSAIDDADPADDYPRELADADFADDDDGAHASAEAVGERLQLEDRGLADWLASARELADAASGSEDRSRHALYAAIGRAYDFSLAAQDEPTAFEALVMDAGLTMQDRAPMTPVVKLVFGVDYDKTRLTEYASALSHGHRLGIGFGELADFLSAADGGLKGVVKAERALKRDERAKPAARREAPRDALARKLRKLEHRSLEAVDADGQEFTLLVARRMPTGDVVLLGEVNDDMPLLERAARKLLG